MQRAPDLSLLLLSGGSLVGQNIVQALGARRRHVRLLATNSVADEPSLQAFDEVLLVPATRTDELALHQALQPWLSAKSPLLVIPCRDDDSVFLAGLQNSAHLGKGCTLLVGAPEPAQAMRDKWLSWELAQRHDLPFAPTLVPLEADRIDAFVARWGFPLLVKPRSGFASQGVRVLLDQRQLAAWAGRDDVVVQRYLGPAQGPEAYVDDLSRQGIPLFHSFETVKQSIQVLIAPDGSVQGTCCTLHRMRNGMSMLVEPDPDPDAPTLGRRCAQVFARLGWRGPLNVQCQRPPGGPLTIYEFNGRFTGATAARTLMGFDEVGMALQAFAHRDIGPVATPPATRVVRQLVSQAPCPELTSALQHQGVWCGAP